MDQNTTVSTVFQWMCRTCSCYKFSDKRSLGTINFPLCNFESLKNENNAIFRGTKWDVLLNSELWLALTGGLLLPDVEFINLTPLPRHFPVTTSVVFLFNRLAGDADVPLAKWGFCITVLHFVCGRFGVRSGDVWAGEELQYKWRYRPRFCFHYCSWDRTQVSMQYLFLSTFTCA